MKFGGAGFWEILIILAVVLIIFGPKNLPKLGQAIGKGVRNLRAGMSGKKDEEDKEENVVNAQAETSKAVPEAEQVVDQDASTGKKKRVVKVVEYVEDDDDDEEEAEEEEVVPKRKKVVEEVAED